MLKKTRIKIMHNGELINTYSKRSGGYGLWGNPFEFIPCVGDYLELTQGKDTCKCKVVSRNIKTKADFVGMFDKQEVILNVQMIYDPIINSESKHCESL